MGQMYGVCRCGMAHLPVGAEDFFELTLEQLPPVLLSVRIPSTSLAGWQTGVTNGRLTFLDPTCIARSLAEYQRGASRGSCTLSGEPEPLQLEVVLRAVLVAFARERSARG